jgi:hypothetical protein
VRNGRAMDSKFVRMEELWIEDIVERTQAPPIFFYQF